MRRRGINAELDAIGRELQGLLNRAHDARNERDFLAARITAAEDKIRLMTAGAPARADGVVAASLKRRALAAQNALNNAWRQIQQTTPEVHTPRWIVDAIDDAVNILCEVVTMPGDI